MAEQLSAARSSRLAHMTSTRTPSAQPKTAVIKLNWQVPMQLRLSAAQRERIELLLRRS